jgi:hypothetical protein
MNAREQAPRKSGLLIGSRRCGSFGGLHGFTELLLDLGFLRFRLLYLFCLELCLRRSGDGDIGPATCQHPGQRERGNEVVFR